MKTQRYKQIQRVQLIIIVLNMAVSVAKMVFGLISNSAAMTADGLHSMTDGLNNIVGMIGVYFAFQPKDKKHPYGHRKFETMTTLIIGVLLIATSINLLRGAYNRFVNPVIPTVNIGSFLVMIFTIAINIFVTKYEKKRGKELQSDFLISDATHTLSDVFVSISVIGTLAAIKLGFPWVDTLVSVIIAILIGKAATDIIKKGSDTLCDATVLDPVEISELVCCFQEVSSCHNIRSRGRGDDTHVDLHVTARNDMSLEMAHNLIHNIDNAIKSAFPGVTDVTVHVDPPGTAC